MSDCVLIETRDGVAGVTLNRPEVLNALDAAMIVRLREACEQVAEDETVRAVLLRGAGAAFLAGGDVAAMRAALPQMPGMVAGLAGELGRAVLALRGAAKPVVAAVHGAVAGAGVSLALACDPVIAAAGTQFTLAYCRIGTSPDGGATYFLPRVVGYQKALELMLLSEPVAAETLVGMGVVNRVVPAAALEVTARRVAESLAAGPTRAFAETKMLVNRGYAQPLDKVLAEEAQAFGRCSVTRDFAEGVSAFVEKRKPRFEGH